MNKTIEYYWKKRFDEFALNFENDADIGIWSKHGFERRFVSFFQFFQENYFTDVWKGLPHSMVNFLGVRLRSNFP